MAVRSSKVPHQSSDSSKSRSGKVLNEYNTVTESAEPTSVLDDRRGFHRPEKKVPIERFQPSTTEQSNGDYIFEDFLVERIEPSNTEQDNDGAYKFEDFLVERIEPTHEQSYEPSITVGRKVIKRPEKKVPSERFRPTLSEQATESFDRYNDVPVESIETSDEALIYEPSDQRVFDRPEKKIPVERFRPSITNEENDFTFDNLLVESNEPIKEQSYEYLSTSNGNIFSRPEKKVPIERYQTSNKEQENDSFQLDESFINKYEPVLDYSVVTERIKSSFLESRKMIIRPEKKVPLERFRPSITEEVYNDLELSENFNKIDPLSADHQFESPTNDQINENELSHIDRFLGRVLGLNKAVENKVATTDEPNAVEIPRFKAASSGTIIKPSKRDSCMKCI